MSKSSGRDPWQRWLSFYWHDFVGSARVKQFNIIPVVVTPVCVKPCLSKSIVSSTLTLLPDRNLQVRLTSNTLGPRFPSPQFFFPRQFEYVRLAPDQCINWQPMQVQAPGCTNKRTCSASRFPGRIKWGNTVNIGGQDVRDHQQGTVYLNLMKVTKH